MQGERICTVHPHACGESARVGDPALRGRGSSPCVWGKPRLDRDGLQVVRFIPTRVGKARGATRRSAIPSVHPHACGESTRSRRRRISRCGSSPRMWGKRRARLHREGAARFIPTHVGKALRILRMIVAAVGSSPHLWGKLAGGALHPLPRRFIPRPVGKVRTASGATSASPVHPHACGESAISGIVGGFAVGSSPRLWGKPDRHRFAAWSRRFIPTPVGKAKWPGPGGHALPVHPHACGESGGIDEGAGLDLGSSPRLWGKLLVGAVR